MFLTIITDVLAIYTYNLLEQSLKKKNSVLQINSLNVQIEDLKFKKKFEKTGILKELRYRTAFEKPSVKRRSEIIRAAYRQKMYASDNY